MKVKESIGRRIFLKANNVFMIFMIFITVYPLAHVLFASLSNSNELLRHRGMLLYPLGFNLEAYKLVFKNPNILNGYIITIGVVVLGTVTNLIMTSIGAFVLSRQNLRGKGF